MSQFTPVLKTFLILLIFALGLVSVHSSCTSCSSHGTCQPAGYCICDAQWLGADCSIGGPGNATLGTFGGSEYTIEFYTDATNLYLRFTWPTSGYFGVIFNAGTNGMSSGDCWAFTVSSSNAATATDYYSQSQSTPRQDSQQDLTNAWGYQVNGKSIVVFRRLLQDGDLQDQQFPAVPGTKNRLSWASGPQQGSGLGKHALMGSTGMFSVDFAGGTFQELNDGVQWPNLYIVYGVVLLITAIMGYLLATTAFRMTTVSRYLRKTVLGIAPQRWPCIDACFCDFRSAFINLSWTEFFFTMTYVATIIVGIVVSQSAYDAVGRSRLYMIGHLASIHLAMTFLPVTRHSIVLWWFGLDFDHTIVWHRRLARVSILLLWIHLVSMFTVWGTGILVDTHSTQWGSGVVFGELALVCFSIMGLTAVPCIRRSAFEVFLHIHHLLVPIGLTMALLHSYQLRYLMIAPGVLWVIDLAWRMSAICLNRAEVVRIEYIASAEPKGRVTVLHLRLKNFKYQPGSLVFLCVPALSKFQWHPFSISSAPGLTKEPDIFTVHILDMGNGTWTHSLGKLCQNLVAVADDVESPGATIQLTVLVDGPFPSRELSICKFPVVILVAGGIGITPMMSWLGSLLLRQQFNPEEGYHVELIWVHRDSTALQRWFPMILQKAAALNPGIRIHLYSSSTTVAPARSPVNGSHGQLGPVPTGDLEMVRRSPSIGNRMNNNNPVSSAFAINPLIQCGRPDLVSLFAEVRKGYSAEGVLPTAVAACGPKRLCDDARAAANFCGFHYHEESFVL